MKNRLKGFTIIEALLSMLILSIIISLTYILFNLLNKQMALFEKENMQVMQYNLFNSTLLYDVHKAIDYVADENQITLKNYDETYVIYTIEKQYVLRQNSIKKDTLKITIEDYKFFDKNNKNSRLQLTYRLLNKSFNAHYFLNKSNSELINETYFNED